MPHRIDAKLVSSSPLTLVTLVSMPLLAVTGCANVAVERPARVSLLLELPIEYHTPNGGDVAPDGTLILTFPNGMNNRRLLRDSVIDEPVPAVIGAIDSRNEISTWYSFAPEDLSEEGTIQPMDAAFGPDGHLYVTVMRGSNSRVLRIHVHDGRPTDATTVVRGLGRANSLAWKDDLLFVTASRLGRTDAALEADQRLISGVYAFDLGQLGDDPVILQPYGEGSQDPHLFVTFETSGSIGVGADGVVVGPNGNLYTAIFEDGTIYRTTLDSDNNVVAHDVLAADERIVSADGIAFSPVDSRIYVADLLANAVHSMDLDGNVSTLYQNGDTTGADGELDAPVALVVRGTQLIVMNQDFVAGSATRNTSTDRPFTISVFDLE